MANQYTFNTPLHKTGNEDSAYRITNLPNQEQRPYLLQNTIYRSDHVVKSQLQHVIHGKLNPGDHVSNNATTIVAKFEFLGQTVDRRFKYARIKWETVYADGDDNDEDTDAPEVRKVSLDGQYVIHESVLSVSKEVHGDAGVQGCCGYGECWNWVVAVTDCRGEGSHFDLWARKIIHKFRRALSGLRGHEFAYEGGRFLLAE
ncbi:hypothetical protein M747DRAFT_337362 [Aspergillus niger ATCC 13496]|uniref:Uncharacterized protein n=1 Tax=Aspergillus niger ATCC 13496 TaxID=1353008 RepID=A0A370CA10_ASPNG|nr:hypothetical protein M747DRAFT_337362 [Aspergillus niger ATCC 13496]